MHTLARKECVCTMIIFLSITIRSKSRYSIQWHLIDPKSQKSQSRPWPKGLRSKVERSSYVVPLDNLDPRCTAYVSGGFYQCLKGTLPDNLTTRKSSRKLVKIYFGALVLAHGPTHMFFWRKITELKFLELIDVWNC